MEPTQKKSIRYQSHPRIARIWNVDLNTEFQFVTLEASHNIFCTPSLDALRDETQYWILYGSCTL